MRPFALLFTVLFPLEWAGAQLTEKPETWTSLEGHYVREASAPEALLFHALCRIEMNRMAMSKEKKPEAAALFDLVNRAMLAGNVNASARLSSRLLAVLRGATPGEWLEVANSLQFLLDRRIAAPGTILHPRIEPLFIIDRPLKGKYTAKVSLLKPDSAPASPPKSLAIESYEPRELSVLTTDLPEGDYRVRYELLDGESRPLAAAERPLLIDSKLRARTTALRARVEKLMLAGASQKSPRHAAAVQTLDYLTEAYDRAFSEAAGSFQASLSPFAWMSVTATDSSYSTEPLRPGPDLEYTETLAALLEAGGDPLAGRTGDLRLAFRSTADQSLQPYRLYVPKNRQPAVKMPLVVVLHAEGGDEGSWMERYTAKDRSHVLLVEAERRGYLVASPLTRGPFSNYKGAAERDVFDLIGFIARIYEIDETKVFLLGHSMGGSAVVPLAIAQPKRFAGLVDIAGVPIQAADYAQAPDVPLLFVEAGKDMVHPPDTARRFAYTLQRRIKRLEYVSFAEEDHMSVVAASLPQIFDYFDQVRAGTWKPSGKPIPLPSTSR